MVVCMHYAASRVVETYGSEEVRRQNAAGKHLLTLAFSEVGSRSHFDAVRGQVVGPGEDHGRHETNHENEERELGRPRRQLEDRCEDVRDLQQDP